MTTLEIPTMGIGTWKYKGDECKESVYNALRLGYRHVDCAFAYGNQDFVGEALKQFLSESKEVKRSEIFITSKLWNSQNGDVEAACRSCLEDLCVDYLDLYLIHWPIYYVPNNHSINWTLVKKNEKTFTDSKYPKDPKTGLLLEKGFSTSHLTYVWKEMEKLVRKGLVKRIGVSNFNIELLKDVIKIAEIKPYCNQIECHPYLKQKELKTFMDKEQIKFVSYSPLGSGNTNLMGDIVIKKAAEKLGCTTCQFNLAWNMAQGNIVIPRSKQYKYLKDNFESQKYVELIKNDKEILDINMGNKIRTCIPLGNENNKSVKRNKDFKF